MRVVLVVVCWLVTLEASAQAIPTCVTVETADSPEPLLRLVQTEVDRHATHRVAPNCSTEIRVELFALDGRRWITGRIDTSVPHRMEVDDSLAEAVEELVTILLHNDPLRLRQPGEDRGLGGALGRLRREGATLWSIEVFELVGLVEGQVFTAPGIALAYRREHAQWSLALHVAIATRTSRVPQRLALMAVADIAFDLRYAFSADAEASGFLGLQVGLEHQWIRGPLASDASRFDSANRTGLFVGIRAGVELFRTARSRLELFAQLNLPLFRARDEEGDVLKAWFPTARAGVALAL